MTVQMYQPGAPALSMSDSARRQALKEIERNHAAGLRVAVKPSGCSGYKYVLDYVTEPSAEDISIELEGGVTLYVDAHSMPLVKGAEIDYVTEGVNQFFKFSNPNSQGECGCGESFSVTA